LPVSFENFIKISSSADCTRAVGSSSIFAIGVLTSLLIGIATTQQPKELERKNYCSGIDA